MDRDTYHWDKMETQYPLIPIVSEVNEVRIYMSQ